MVSILASNPRGNQDLEILRRINHENVLKLIYNVQTIDGPIEWERCEFTLFDNLADAVESIGEIKILLQISKGLKHLHTQRIVHCNLKPWNIWVKNNQIKIGGFDLFQETDENGSFVLDGNNQMNSVVLGMPTHPIVNSNNNAWSNSFVWPERLNISNQLNSSITRMTNKIDGFDLGCVFFYVLTRGSHPFGESLNEVILNVKTTTQVNPQRLLLEKPFAHDLIQCMLRKKPQDRPALGIATKWLEHVIEGGNNVENWKELFFSNNHLPEDLWITWNSEMALGESKVFAGTWKGDDVAVKIFFEHNLFSQNGGRSRLLPSLDSLKQLSHENVLTILSIHKSSIDDLYYVALERCTASLFDFWKNPRDCGYEVPEEWEAFKQMASGLRYIHSNDLVHGALRPTNVLISHASSSSVQLKLSDFGIRNPGEQGSVTTSNTNTNYGINYLQDNYKAPELLRHANDDRPNTNGQGPAFIVESPNMSCDVFSLGCLFYGYATQGKHPFRERRERPFKTPINIMEGKIKMEGTMDRNSAKGKLILGMLENNPSNRKSLENIIATIRRI